MTREELRRLKMGDEYSDEYDDEVDSFEMEYHRGTDANSIDALRGARSRNNKVGAITTGETKEISIEDFLLPCPDGFDPVKWSVMTLKEKLAYLGIDMKTWNKMYREEHLRRLNKHAEGFHFYALDKKLGKADEPDFKKV